MAEPVSRILYIEDDELDRIAFSRYVKKMRLNYAFDIIKDISTCAITLLTGLGDEQIPAHWN